MESRRPGETVRTEQGASCAWPWQKRCASPAYQLWNECGDKAWIIYFWLVVSTLRKIWKSVGIMIPNVWKKNKCSKLPTRFKQFIENILNLLLGSAREVTAWSHWFWFQGFSAKYSQANDQGWLKQTKRVIKLILLELLFIVSSLDDVHMFCGHLPGLPFFSHVTRDLDPKWAWTQFITWITVCKPNTPRSNLVGGWPIPLKNMTSSVGMMKFPIHGKKKCLKPPTRLSLLCLGDVNYNNPDFYYESHDKRCWDHFFPFCKIGRNS